MRSKAPASMSPSSTTACLNSAGETRAACSAASSLDGDGRPTLGEDRIELVVMPLGQAVAATANPAFRRQLGQSPRGASEGNGPPHSGQQGVCS